jgi:hypothetical protein
MSTPLEVRAAFVEQMIVNLQKLPADEGVAMAAHIFIELARRAGMPDALVRRMFAACMEHNEDGLEPELEK